MTREGRPLTHTAAAAAEASPAGSQQQQQQCADSVKHCLSKGSVPSLWVGLYWRQAAWGLSACVVVAEPSQPATTLIGRRIPTDLHSCVLSPPAAAAAVPQRRSALVPPPPPVRPRPLLTRSSLTLCLLRWTRWSWSSPSSCHSSHLNPPSRYVCVFCGGGGEIWLRCHSVAYHCSHQHLPSRYIVTGEWMGMPSPLAVRC